MVMWSVSLKVCNEKTQRMKYNKCIVRREKPTNSGKFHSYKLCMNLHVLDSKHFVGIT